MFRTGVEFSSCDANIPLTFWRLSSVRLATVAVIVGKLTVTTLLLIGVCVLCCVGLVFSHKQPRDRLGETSPKWPILCRVAVDVKPQLNLSVSSLSLSVRAPTWFFCSSINATAARVQKNTTNPKIAWSLIASLPRVGGLQLSVVVAKQDDRFSSTDTRQQWLAVPAVDGSYFLHGRGRV